MTQCPRARTAGPRNPTLTLTLTLTLSPNLHESCASGLAWLQAGQAFVPMEERRLGAP